MATDFSWDYASYPGYEKYPHLFKPIQMGKLTIPNRIKYAANAASFARITPFRFRWSS
jgi:hypothetical protein